MRLETLTVAQMAAYYYPRMMGLHNASDETDEAGKIRLPEMLNLTSESMSQDGIYLMEDGEMMIMWIGRSADPGILQANFGATSFDELDTNAVEVQLMQGAPESKIARILARVRQERA